MEDLAGWIAPIATTVAACMTAANLGARMTGSGFVIFTAGSLAWAAYGAATGQPNLIWQNLLLTAINAAGAWRWLGRQAGINDSAQTVSERSEMRPGPSLFSSSMLQQANIETEDGETIGKAVDAMIDCDEGRIAYMVVGTGGVAGVGETLRVLPWDRARAENGTIVARIAASEIATLAEVRPGHWPTNADVHRA